MYMACVFLTPADPEIAIKLNAWDFGGQEVYRVTHQFFFSGRSLYVLVWEPRRGVNQCQVEDWLRLIRLRVGSEARVLVVSTHCKTGHRIARIDQAVLKKEFDQMIVGFLQVDSLVDDPTTGEKHGIAELKLAIAEAAANLDQMGMLLNPRWREARDDLLALMKPHIAFAEFLEVCEGRSLDGQEAVTLARLMHDLGYIVHYGSDEHLKDNVVLQPEWLTKAIGFVLEDSVTRDSDGILQDSRLRSVWQDHAFPGEPQYDPSLYPFFLRLMQKFDVCYRLPSGDGSLVSQHVSQIRPELPWLPETMMPAHLSRIAMVCSMDEDPPGLVPWMIVRTHDYAVEETNNQTGTVRRLHWQKGMFLRDGNYGEALLEQSGLDFNIYVQAEWPDYFMNVVQHTVSTLISDNWPGLKGHYHWLVPCRETVKGKHCNGRFSIDALRSYRSQGERYYPCQVCFKRQSIDELLLGIADSVRDKHSDVVFIEDGVMDNVNEQFSELRRHIDSQMRGLRAEITGEIASRIANYVMALMHAIANEAKDGPRLFTLTDETSGEGAAPKRLLRRGLRLQLWCEAEGCQHPVCDGGGIYTFERPHEWVVKTAPYTKWVVALLKTCLPVAGPAVDAFFGKDTARGWKLADRVAATEALMREVPSPDEVNVLRETQGFMNEKERSGLLALHALLKDLDPHQERLGVTRVATYTGDYRWLCEKHLRAWEPRIPESFA